MKYFDTHSHIQFKIFDQDREQVIKQANDAGVESIIAVGTDLESSKKAVEVADKYPSVYAAVGIHPHHVFSYLSSDISYQQEMKEVAILIKNQKVIAIGETGLDAHTYSSTKYPDYKITAEFLRLQNEVFLQHIKLSIQHKKTLIIHNRGMADQLVEILEKNWDSFFSKRSVFHCCEPNKRLLEFAKKNHIFIGVDGDVTYDKLKQSFVKEIPLDLLVLETDSPFFVPEPLKSQGFTKNAPQNITHILSFLDNFIGQNVQLMSRNNAHALFKL
jgi:TatD DNase family protein